jgi:hypothetical protein
MAVDEGGDVIGKGSSNIEKDDEKLVEGLMKKWIVGEGTGAGKAGPGTQAANQR